MRVKRKLGQVAGAVDQQQAQPARRLDSLSSAGGAAGDAPARGSEAARAASPTPAAASRPTRASRQMAQDKEMARKLQESFRSSDYKKILNAKLRRDPDAHSSSGPAMAVDPSMPTSSIPGKSGKKQAKPTGKSQKVPLQLSQAVHRSGHKVSNGVALQSAHSAGERYIGQTSMDYTQWLACHGFDDLRGDKMLKTFRGYGACEGTVILPPAPTVINGVTTAFADIQHPYCIRYSDGDMMPIAANELEQCKLRHSQGHAQRQKAVREQAPKSNFLASLSGANLSGSGKPVMAARKYATSSLADLKMWEDARRQKNESQGAGRSPDKLDSYLHDGASMLLDVDAATKLLDAQTIYSCSKEYQSTRDEGPKGKIERAGNRGNHPESNAMKAWGPRRGKSPQKAKATNKHSAVADSGLLRYAAGLLLLAATKSEGTP